MPIRVQSAPLPSNFKGTPQELVQAILDRLDVTSDDQSFVISDTEPPGNQGPWLKSGQQWWVWNESTSEYIPLDLSASSTQQIFVGPVTPAPDPTLYQFWLQIDASNNVLGLFYWFGDVAGWVTQPVGVQPDSVYTDALQTGCVTRDKIKNQEVTADKIANNLPLSKLAQGAANQVPTMGADGSAAQWRSPYQVSAELAFSNHSVVQTPHGLSATPMIVRGVFVCKTTDLGWAVNDEIDLASSVTLTVSTQYQMFANATNVGVLLGAAPFIGHKSVPGDTHQMTPANWKIKFYFAQG